MISLLQKKKDTLYKVSFLSAMCYEFLLIQLLCHGETGK